jgi:hypothetical protein
MTDIYDQHDKAFPNVAAYVVMKGAERVATVAFKYPRDGAGRLWAYVHIIGLEMTRGYAGGYGYDKHTAAVSVAARKIKVEASETTIVRAHAETCRAAMERDGGQYWYDTLRRAGFEVFQAV